MLSKTVALEENLIAGYLNNKKWQQLSKYLRDKFVINRHDLTGQPKLIVVSEKTIELLSSILKGLYDVQNVNTDKFDLIKEVFRSLRNSTAFNPEVQIMITKNPYLLQNTLDIFNQLLSLNDNGKNECGNMILQFLINVITKNAENALIVWKIFEKVISESFTKEEYSYYTSGLFYNILLMHRYLITNCSVIYGYILDNVASDYRHVYHTFLLEILVQDSSFMTIYETLEVSRRVILLLAVADFVSNKEENFNISSDGLCQLSTIFKTKSDSILKTVVSYADNIEPREVVLLLEILASLSSEEGYGKKLQEDEGLIINCAYLLKSVHTLGKESQNHFTPIQKLSEVASTNNETRKNPIFGFKADLIRLLGNVCWKNKENQDKLRELDCIALLLDCCNIDARNPFIIQWTILAIRNLCDGNSRNQTVIAGMTKRGVVNSSTLQEMGLTLHDDGTNKIVLGPLPEKK